MSLVINDMLHVNCVNSLVSMSIESICFKCMIFEVKNIKFFTIDTLLACSI